MHHDLTIILLNYNYAHFLEKSLGGILNQTILPAKLIIIDDASSDDSVGLITKMINPYLSKLEIHTIFHTQNQGINENCNLGLNLVKTPYVFFAASDDIVYRNFTKYSMDLLHKNPTAAFCTTLADQIDQSGQKLAPIYIPHISAKSRYLSPIICQKYLKIYGSWFIGTSRIIQTQLLKNYDGFNPKLASLSDVFMSVLLASQYGACFIPEYLVSTRIHQQAYSNQISQNLEKSLNYLETAENLFKQKYQTIIPNKLSTSLISKWRLTAALNFLNTNPKKLTWPELKKILPVINFFQKTLIYSCYKTGLLTPFVLCNIINPLDVYLFYKQKLLTNLFYRS